MDSEEEKNDLMPMRTRSQHSKRDLDYFPKQTEEDSEEGPIDAMEQEELSDLEENAGAKRKAKSKAKKDTQKHRTDAKANLDPDEVEGDQNGDTIYIDNLPNDAQQIKAMLREVKKHIIDLEKQFFIEENSEDDEANDQTKLEATHEANSQEMLPTANAHIKRQHYCIPLSVNVVGYDFDKLVEAQLKHANGRLFDVITIDPPWQLSSANPTRGVAIAYSTLSDSQILDETVLPFMKLQTDGFLMVWVINAKYRLALELFEENEYTMVDELTWVK